MPPDPALVERVRKALARRRGVEERAMFGARTFLVDGKLALGVRDAELMVRVGPEQEPALAREPGARPFDHKGRRMGGWLLVAPEGMASDAALAAWVARGLAAARGGDRARRAPRR